MGARAWLVIWNSYKQPEEITSRVVSLPHSIHTPQPSERTLRILWRLITLRKFGLGHASVDLSMHLTFRNFLERPVEMFKQEIELSVDGFRATGICPLNNCSLFGVDFITDEVIVAEAAELEFHHVHLHPRLMSHCQGLKAVSQYSILTYLRCPSPRGK
jgi:hypothetical protein